MNTQFPVTTVSPENLDKVGFFCYMSARKTPGYAFKHGWVSDRLVEGLRIKMVLPPEGRGFIEYIPGEFAWRAVNAARYMVIHCLWVVGKSKGSGISSQLMDICEEEALQLGMAGVVMITREDHYMVRRSFLEARGYIQVDEAPPAYSLMVKKYQETPEPSFCGRWEEKAQALGSGLTVIRAHQCPYLESAKNAYQTAAEDNGIEFKDIILRSAKEVRDRSPLAQGVFSLVLNGKIMGDQYLYTNEASLHKMISEEIEKK